MKSVDRMRRIAIAALAAVLLLPVAGCPTMSPPPQTPDLGDFVRARLVETSDAEPVDINDDQGFADPVNDDFRDVIADPAAFGVPDA